jgi:hypothetical protein
MINRKLIAAALFAGGLTIALPAMAQSDAPRPFDPARDVYLYNPVPNDYAALTGTVTSIQGLKFMTITDAGTIVGVDMAELPYNPTSPEYEPRLEIGDTVTLTGYVSDMPSEVTAREIVSVKKPFMASAEGQRLIIEDEFPADIAPAAGDPEGDRIQRRPMAIQN